MNALLRAAFAVWGLAIAISLYAVWDQPAQPGQLPGAATSMNLDARAPFRFVAGLILLPLLLSLVTRPLARRFAEARPWARNTVLIAPLVTLWFATLVRAPMWTIVPCAIAIALAYFFRETELAFTRNDVVLLPVLLTTMLGVFDARIVPSVDTALLVSLLVVLILRIAVALIPRDVPPAFAFLAAPLGLVLQTNFFARDQRYVGWHALALVVVTPFLLRLFLRNAKLARTLLVFAIYPLSLYSYVNATSMLTAEGKPRVNVFEDSHALLPASEYLRGERAYRDILPAHGLLEDGLFDYAALLTREPNIGTAARARSTIAGLGIVAVYALGTALTGSAEAGLFAGFLTLLTGYFRASLRFLPALIALAFLLRRRMRAAGFWTVIAGITSLDYAAYTFITLIVDLVRTRRARCVRDAAIGIAIGVVPLFLALLVLGVFDDFLYGTFIEVLSLGPVYTLTMFTLPPALQHIRTFPEVLAGLFHRDTLLYLFWPAVAVALPLKLPRRFFLLAVWIVLTAVSYAERHHLYYMVVAPTFLVGMTFFLRRWRIPLIATLIILAAPSVHLGVVSMIRSARGSLEPHWVTIDDIPRARGALFHQDDAATIASVRKYLSLALGPNDTFLDFSNRGLYYFLFRRDSPIRQYEVAFYETEERQREVIARIENNPRVRAVLLPGPSGRYTVDGIINPARAPLVWDYIQTHFEPDFAEGDVVFWRRK